MPWSGPRIVSAAGASTSIRVHFLDLGGRSWPTDRPPARCEMGNTAESGVSSTTMVWGNRCKMDGRCWMKFLFFFLA